MTPWWNTEVQFARSAYTQFERSRASIRVCNRSNHVSLEWSRDRDIGLIAITVQEVIDRLRIVSPINPSDSCRQTRIPRSTGEWLRNTT